MRCFTSRRVVPHLAVCCLFGAALLMLLPATPLAAQLTPKKLLAPTVEQYGSQYQDVEVAFKAYNRRDFAGARASLQAACEKNPELSPADVMLALIHLSGGRRTEAEEAIERAVVQRPDDPEAYILLADLALRDGRRTIADLGYQRGRQLLSSVESNPHRLRNLKIRPLNDWPPGDAAAPVLTSHSPGSRAGPPRSSHASQLASSCASDVYP